MIKPRVDVEVFDNSDLHAALEDKGLLFSDLKSARAGLQTIHAAKKAEAGPDAENPPADKLESVSDAGKAD